MVVSVPARASHYDLSSIDLVDAQTVAKLAGMKVFTTADLFAATNKHAQVTKLAKALKVKPAVVTGWRDFCGLLRIDGVGPKVVRVFLAAKIPDTARLAAQETADLTRKIKSTNAEAQVLGKLPDEDTVRHWIEQARTLHAADTAKPKKKR
jgi:predicted flap endonuclease-1-like 5' DNA nuclease